MQLISAKVSPGVCGLGGRHAIWLLAASGEATAQLTRAPGLMLCCCRATGAVRAGGPAELRPRCPRGDGRAGKWGRGGSGDTGSTGLPSRVDESPVPVPSPAGQP